MAGNSGYKGPERRRAERRVNTDRRKDVRWEPGKTNRRSGSGRRAADKIFDKDTWRK